jgi:hypothetical protein
METPSGRSELKQSILAVVERQLETGDPPETGQTLDRLLALGYCRQEAIQLIGSAVLQEIWWMMQEHPASQDRLCLC